MLITQWKMLVTRFGMLITLILVWIIFILHDEKGQYLEKMAKNGKKDLVNGVLKKLFSDFFSECYEFRGF